MKIVFATKNNGKMKEIKSIFNNDRYEVLSLKEIGMEIEIVENGETFQENALIKAQAVAKALGDSNTIVMADDSGLEVDYLDKEPGIYSARYLGEDTSYHIKNAKIIERLDGVPFEKRTARFVCAIAAVYNNQKTIVTQATMEGYIGYEEMGENGFGYDPIFYIKEYDCSTAQLSMEKKNKISHRGKALREMKVKLENENIDSK